MNTPPAAPPAHHHGANHYGADAYSANPYAAPVGAPHGLDPYALPIAEGSYRLGIVLGFLLGLWGFIGCLIFGKRDTKRGAGHGLLARIGLTLVIVVGAILFDTLS